MTKQACDLLLINASQILTMEPSLATCDPKDEEASKLGIIEDGAIAILGGAIADVGPTALICESWECNRVMDVKGCIVSPGLIDAHTHLVFAGSRHLEHDMRAKGATYHEILKAQGGIHSTVRATREASLDELVEVALQRLRTLMSFGVTTAEVKSGYGLDVETELKILKAVKILSSLQPIRLYPTYLGAHVVPIEYKTNRKAYVDLVADRMIPEVASRGLAKACDVFLDKGAFELDEAEKILIAARDHGLGTKIHAGQFTDKGGPELAARLGSLSAEHLEHVSNDGVMAMAKAGVVAVLLPGAAFSLGDDFPDARRFIDAGVDVAVATDDNPGTSFTENLPLMAQMAVARMGMSSGEAFRAVTVNGAKALGLEDLTGSIALKKSADLAVFSAADFRIPLYHFGVNHVSTVVAAGRIVS